MKFYYKIALSLVVCTFCLYSCDNENNSEDFSANKANLQQRLSQPILDGDVLLGTNLWKTKNLNVSRYRNGDVIPQVTDPVEWSNLTTGAWCYLDNNPLNGPKYGKLYNQYAVEDPRGLAPAGWHIATWSNVNQISSGAVWGPSLMATTGWGYNATYTPTNYLGFSAIPVGQRDSGGVFNFGDFYTNWWLGKPVNGTNPYDYFGIVNYSSQLQFGNTGMISTYGMAVRCVKD